MCGRELKIRSFRFPVRWRPDFSYVVIAILAGLLIWQFLQRSDRIVTVEVPVVTVLPPTLPAPTPTPPPTPTPVPVVPTLVVPTPAPLTHVVQSGEVLVYIANLYNVEVEDLMRMNNLETTTIHPGVELTIPGQTRNVVIPRTTPVPQWTTDFVYNVQAGDSIISIAFRFGTEPAAIFAANDLGTDSILHKGDLLVIPIPRLSQEVLGSSELAPRTTNAIYASPRLLGPANTALVSRKDSVLFRWLSVDILAPNEWYVLRIWTANPEDVEPPTVWTKATSFRMETTLAPPEGTSQEYLWQVTVVRVVAPGIPGAPRELQSASLSSDVRQFTWQ